MRRTTQTYKHCFKDEKIPLSISFDGPSYGGSRTLALYSSMSERLFVLTQDLGMRYRIHFADAKSEEERLELWSSGGLRDNIFGIFSSGSSYLSYLVNSVLCSGMSIEEAVDRAQKHHLERLTCAVLVYPLTLGVGSSKIDKYADTLTEICEELKKRTKAYGSLFVYHVSAPTTQKDAVTTLDLIFEELIKDSPDIVQIPSD